ncbi:MAG TPA: hypothetical protein VFN17_00700 [Nitrosarchaeum sp.]|nr:hypothetical protein [Nitrosarchaeum sp.]
MNYLAIAAVALVLPTFVIGNSILKESERYLLLLDTNTTNDVYLEFYDVESIKNRQVIIDKGFVLLEDKEFEIIEDWKGRFLNEDRLFFMAGVAENADEDIAVFLVGKFLKKTIDGSLYDITVHIHSDQTIEFQTEGKIVGLVPKESIKEMETETPIDLLFLIKDTHHRFQDQEYVFTTKIYDRKQNSLGEWNAKGGEISGAEIAVKVMDLQGNTLREINGITNEFGWFEGKFPLGITFPRGEYLVTYMAKFQNNTIEENMPLYVFEVKTDANYRHFTPTSDIDRGHWLDNRGNQNNLMYDDLDEYTQDDSDYVHSRGLGKNQASDTLHLQMSTYAGVTTDHNHIVSYTLSKDSSGGNEIKFTVTLFEGTREIAQWTYLNVDENFNLITNILTRDQAKSISDYNNLSLEFTAECTSCDGAKREGQISWVHMIV